MTVSSPLRCWYVSHSNGSAPIGFEEAKHVNITAEGYAIVALHNPHYDHYGTYLQTLCNNSQLTIPCQRHAKRLPRSTGSTLLAKLSKTCIPSQIVHCYTMWFTHQQRDLGDGEAQHAHCVCCSQQAHSSPLPRAHTRPTQGQACLTVSQKTQVAMYQCVLGYTLLEERVAQPQRCSVNWRA